MRVGLGLGRRANRRGGGVWGLYGVPGRQAFVEEGLAAVLFRKKPTGRHYRKLDGVQEAQLIAVACGTPPAGRGRWTLQLLADRRVELEVVESISPECVRMTLKKTN